MSEIERGIFCLLLSHPELVSIAVMNLDSVHFESSAGRAMWRLYVDAEMEGRQSDQSSLLSSCESPSLKSLLVSAVMDSESVDRSTDEFARKSFESLLKRILERDREIEEARRVATLESNSLSPQEELQLFAEIVGKARNKREITS
jgi:hypothetical protein